MRNDTPIDAIGLRDVDDPLTELLRTGAQRQLVQAVEAEAETFLAMMSAWRLAGGRALGSFVMAMAPSV